MNCVFKARRVWPRLAAAFFSLYLAKMALADSYRYEWVGGQAGFGGYLDLSSAEEEDGTIGSIIGGQMITPVGTFDFASNTTVLFQLIPFSWDPTKITSMIMAWEYPDTVNPTSLVVMMQTPTYSQLSYTITLPDGDELYAQDRSGTWLATSSWPVSDNDAGIATLIGAAFCILEISRRICAEK